MSGQALQDMPTPSLWITKAWYLLFFASLVTILPYLNVYYYSLGFIDTQLGLVSALRPWLSAPASFGWSSLADRFSIHRWILVIALLISTSGRCLLVLEKTSGFGVVLATVLTVEAIGAGVCVMVDSAVLSVCQGGEYGKVRLWGAVGWGIFSLVAGVVIDRFGISSAFAMHALLAAPCLPLAYLAHAECRAAAAARSKATLEQNRVAAKAVGAMQVHLDDLASGDAHTVVELSKVHGKVPRCTANAKEEEAVALLAGSGGGSEDDEHIRAAKRLPACDDAAVQLCQGAHVSSTCSLCNLTIASGDAATAAGMVASHLKAMSKVTGREPSMFSLEDEADEDEEVGLVGKAAASSETWGLLHDQVHKPSALQSPLSMYTTAARAADTARFCTCSNPAAALQSDIDNTNSQKPWVNLGDSRRDAEISPPGTSMPFLGRLLLLVQDTAVLAFALTAVVMGTGYGVIASFLFVFIQQLGGSQTLMGLTLTVTCASEVPFFHLQSAMMRACSINTLQDLVLVAYVIRLSYYALLPFMGSPWAVLPVEILHGFTFALAWGVGSVRAKQLAPTGLEATLQGAFQGLFMGLGFGIGALSAGLIAQHTGSLQIAFSCAAVGVACLGALSSIARRVTATTIG